MDNKIKYLVELGKSENNRRMSIILNLIEIEETDDIKHLLAEKILEKLNGESHFNSWDFAFKVIERR